VIQIYRLHKKKHAGSAFTGEGAAKYGGRWNHPGIAMVYTSATTSLAILEIMANSEPSEIADLTMIYQVHSAAIDKGVLIFEPKIADLPAGWDDPDGHPDVARDLGSQWMQEGKFCVIRVPSAVQPTESNFLLNPHHPDANKVRLLPVVPAVLDPRIIKRLSV